jgi:thioredoxin reductase
MQQLKKMDNKKNFDVIIVGGSYSGLAAAMALGRALRKVLIIDSGMPCNATTPGSHNFLTRDGESPGEITLIAKQQLQRYPTVQFVNGLASHGIKNKKLFEIHLASGNIFYAGKLIFATGIRDLLPGMDGFAACWGISVLHCPYCHGYEVKNEKTAIFGNGGHGYDLAKLISNWTKQLTIFTNGPSTFTAAQKKQLEKHDIKIIEKTIGRLEHSNGYVEQVIFKNGTGSFVKVIYAAMPFEQHCGIPGSLGCTLTDEGYIKVDPSGETTIAGVFACGDSITRTRTLANAVATGTTAGMMLNKRIIFETF